MTPIIGFDADDTIWHNEGHYTQAAEKFLQLLQRYEQGDRVRGLLSETEIRNISWYGYGIKSYVLSMIEAAIALSAGKIPGADIQKILDIGQEMLSAHVQPYENVPEVLTELASRHELMLITKGDLVEQGQKIDRSGLAGYFRHIEIMPEKTAASYRQLLERRAVSPGDFLMVGNSLRSDILPVLQIGGGVVYIPAPNTWVHEHVEESELEREAFHELEHLGQLPKLIARLVGQRP